MAQSVPTVSRPVVQRPPSAASQRLSAALARIARDPRDYMALVDAGDAANSLGDPEAAVGFYTRADAISPNNARIKAGMARALVLQGDPIKAIPLFAAAEAGGAGVDVTSDRGLAYDLVGDPITAQRYYRAALTRNADDETRRRLGVSLAITGDTAGSEVMLMPLLREQDKPGWRSHAFALAIEGKTKEAVDTVNAILPGPLAQSVTPYLRYMPRLTRAQQAAAANLGKFPRASEIGRDDPAIAAYAASATRMASADAGLIPRGQQLGSGARSVPAAPPLTRSQRRAQEKAAQLARASSAAASRVAPPDPQPAISQSSDGELPAIGGGGRGTLAMNDASRPTVQTTTSRQPLTPAPSPAPSASYARRETTVERAAVPAANQNYGAIAGTGAATVRSGSIVLPGAVSASPAANPGSAALASAQPQVPGRSSVPTTPPAAPASPALASGFSAAPTPPPTATANTAPVPGFDLARLAPTAGPSASGTSTPPPAAGETPPDPVSLEKIFADLGSPSRAAAPVSGAVDIRAIVPAKDVPVREPEVVASEAPALAKAATAKPGSRKAAEAKLADAGATDTKAAPLKDAKLDPKKTKADAKKTEAKKAEDKKKADAEKQLKSNPSRTWVQIGVGRSMDAIAFDWRRFVKENPALLKGRKASTNDMGRTNRILVGPFETQKAASAFVAQAKKADFAGAFVWSSTAGQVVEPLGAK
ncbi:SPOR domain-containing protein [uncultured Novosphingobium sp.]|uniref:SPOR domain-containing protein n=1 Tax=uncultured Novosphingobium sp. TaxID=292277 RepID=UPI00374A3EDF